MTRVFGDALPCAEIYCIKIFTGIPAIIIFCVNPSCVETGILWDNLVNTVVTVALEPWY